MQGLLPCIKWGNIAPLRYNGEPVWRNNQPLLKFNRRAWPFIPFIKGFSNSNIVLISKHVMHLYFVNNNNSIVNCSCSSTPKALRQFCNRCVFESTQRGSGSVSVLLWCAFRDGGCPRCKERMGAGLVKLFGSKPCMWEQAYICVLPCGMQDSNLRLTFHTRLPVRACDHRSLCYPVTLLLSARPIYGQYENCYTNNYLRCVTILPDNIMGLKHLSLKDGLNW